MTVEQARQVLRAYAAARGQLHEAVRVLSDADVPQAEIVRESGLSRDGVRKIVARHEATA